MTDCFYFYLGLSLPPSFADKTYSLAVWERNHDVWACSPQGEIKNFEDNLEGAHLFSGVLDPKYKVILGNYKGDSAPYFPKRNTTAIFRKEKGVSHV